MAHHDPWLDHLKSVLCEGILWKQQPKLGQTFSEIDPLSFQQTHEQFGGLYTPTAFPGGLRRTEGKQNTYFFAFSPQYFSDDFLVLVRAFLVRPQSPTDFSDGLPMD